MTNLFHNNIVRFLGRRIWQNVRYKWSDVVAVMLHLMYLMIHFLCRKLIKIIVPEKFFQIYFLLVTATTNKLDDGIPVGHFYNSKYRYSKRYLNYKQICRQCTDNTFFQYWYLNHKQIHWQHTSNVFLGLQHRYFWQNDTFPF